MNESTRILVFGYSEVGHACLKFLLDQKENVIGAFTHEDNPLERAWFPSVEALATGHKVPVWKDSSSGLRNKETLIRALNPDLIFSFYYRFIIPESIFSLPSLGAYNMHGSLLPKFRGRAPVNWAVLMGEEETGATLHVMTDKADCGDIVDRQSVPIGPDDSAGLIQSRVTEAAVKILERQLQNLKTGRIQLTPQDHDQATKFGRRKPEDGAIKWNHPARDIHNLVRAVSHPYPGAFTDIFGAKTFIWKSRLMPESSIKGKPGDFRVTGGQCVVFCGDGVGLEILRAQREGGRERDGIQCVKDLLANKKEAVK